MDQVRLADDASRFQIGVVPVALRSGHASAMADFGRLYAGCACDALPGGEIDIRVTRTRGRWGLLGYHEIWGDGVRRFAIRRPDGVLPHIEWAINWQVMLHLPRFLQVHAAVAARNGRAVMLVGLPGAGKSTLAAGLLSRGWRYSSDEFALIDPESLHVHAYPKALCVKKGSYEAVRRLGLGSFLKHDYHKGKKGRVAFVPHRAFGAESIGTSCPVGHVVFCQWRGGATPHVERLSRAEAVLRLTRLSFNFGKFRGRGVAAFVELVRRAECHVLTSGPLEATCDLVESLGWD